MPAPPPPPVAAEPDADAVMPPAKLMPPQLAAAKQQLRSAIKASLASVAPESVAAQSRRCTQQLLALDEFRRARRVSVFLSMPRKEIDTNAIVEHALSSGKTLYVPYIHRRPAGSTPTLASTTTAAPAPPPPPSVMDMLALANLEDYASLQPDAWGIPSLPSASITSRHNCLDETEGTDTAGLDLVVMPGVAFDRQFRRLGHGKGYYDYWLQRCQEKFGRVPLLVAIAMKEQLVDEATEVPTDPLDWTVDVIVTGDGEVLRRRRPQ